jgi:hypothetical protein
MAEAIDLPDLPVDSLVPQDGGIGPGSIRGEEGTDSHAEGFVHSLGHGPHTSAYALDVLMESLLVVTHPASSPRLLLGIPA